VAVALCAAAAPATNPAIATVNATMQIRRKLDTIPPLPRIAAVLRTPMTRIRIKLIGSRALGTAAVTTW
jgi:hypothetical protein